jgi:hypothetical protein
VSSTSRSSAATATAGQPGDGPPASQAPPGSGPRTFPLEPDFDRTSFDAVAYAPLALGHASELLPNPQIALVRAAGVGEAGLVDLTRDAGQVTYLFRKGEGPACVKVLVNEGVVIMQSEPGACGSHVPIRLPKCSLPHAVGLVTHGMKLPDGLSGTLSYLSIRGTPRWRMEFGSGFTRELVDGC